MPILLGIPLSPMTRAKARRRLLALLDRPGCARVFTPNATMLAKAAKEPALGRLLRSADLLLPDGTGVVLASRLRGDAPLPCRLCGIDMAEWLLTVAARQGLRVFFLGGRPGVAPAAARRMTAKYPGLSVVGTAHGYHRKDDAVLNAIRKTEPDLLYVCMGFPRQERWIAEQADKLPTLSMALGLGGSFDVWSGRLPRAPRVLQRMGLEWLWRTAREPRRLRDLAALPRFLLGCMKKDQGSLR